MLKDKRIWILALASFARGTEAFVYAGHLNALASDSGNSIAAAGVLFAVSGPIVFFGEGLGGALGGVAILALAGSAPSAFAPRLSAFLGWCSPSQPREDVRSRKVLDRA